MKLPFLWIAISFAVGVLFELCFPLPHPVLFLSSLICFPILWAKRDKKEFLIILSASLFLLGAWHASFDQYQIKQTVSAFVSPSSVSLQGRVQTEPRIKKRGKKVTVSFVLESENLMRWAKEGGQRRRELFKTEGKVQVFMHQPASIPSWGERIRVYGRLEKPRAPKNPGQFDYPKYLAQQGIHVILNAYGGQKNRFRKPSFYSPLTKRISKVRGWIRHLLERSFSDEYRPLLKALILGERKDLSASLRDSFMKTGTMHLLAISGLHVGLVAGSFYGVFLLTLRRQKGAALMALMVIVFYVAISGARIPAMRAGTMAGIGLVALLCERQRNALNLFCLVFFLFLMVRPSVIMQLSFQLSFLSVLSLVLFLRVFEEKWSWAEIFMRTGMVMIGTFPLVIYYFQIFSPVSFIANIVAIPCVHLALLFSFGLLLCGGLPFLASMMASGAEALLSLALTWIHFCSKIPWGYFFIPRPPLWEMFFYYMALMLLYGMHRFKPKKKTLKTLALSLWLLAAGLCLMAPQNSQFSVTFLAAGKNEIAHIQVSAQRHWLVNTGRGFPSDQARWLIEPYLRSRGIHHLEGIILMGGYKKHTGGVYSLAKQFSPEYLIYPSGVHAERMAYSKKVNFKGLRGREEIGISSQTGLEVLDVIDGKLLFLVKREAFQILFLPDIHEGVEAVLRRNRAKIKDAMWHFPALSLSKQKRAVDILEEHSPHTMIVPNVSSALEEYASENEIRIWVLEKTGALSIEEDESRVKVTSFFGLFETIKF